MHRCFFILFERCLACLPRFSLAKNQPAKMRMLQTCPHEVPLLLTPDSGLLTQIAARARQAQRISLLPLQFTYYCSDRQAFPEVTAGSSTWRQVPPRRHGGAMSASQIEYSHHRHLNTARQMCSVHPPSTQELTLVNASLPGALLGRAYSWLTGYAQSSFCIQTNPNQMAGNDYPTRELF